MSFVRDHADRASVELASERGVFPAWSGSIYDPASGDPRGGPRYRNATRTTVAPTGTLSIIADCSGGIEPAFALAFMRQHHLDRKDPTKVTRLPEVNATFRAIAERAGFYSDELARYLAEGGALASRDDVPDWAKRIFVTAHDVSPEWHVKMQAAFQRHTDNAVSKTINFPAEATVDDVERAYVLAYREGCKGITVYRDGSRDRQVLSHATARGPEQAEAAAAEIALGFAELLPEGAHPEPHGSTEPRAAGRPYRRHLPDERRSITHKFRVGDQEGYVTVGLYDEGAPGEIFVNISKEGSTIRGLMDAVAMLTSIALQYGVPLENLVAKFRGVHFEPAGLTGNPQIPTASSLVDYIFRWLGLRFLAPATGPGTERRRVAGAEEPAQTRGRRAIGRCTNFADDERARPADVAVAEQPGDQHRPRLPRLRLHPCLRRGLPRLPRLRLQQVRLSRAFAPRTNRVLLTGEGARLPIQPRPARNEQDRRQRVPCRLLRPLVVVPARRRARAGAARRRLGRSCGRSSPASAAATPSRRSCAATATIR